MQKRSRALGGFKASGLIEFRVEWILGWRQCQSYKVGCLGSCHEPKMLPSPPQTCRQEMDPRRKPMQTRSPQILTADRQSYHPWVCLSSSRPSSLQQDPTTKSDEPRPGSSRSPRMRLYLSPSFQSRSNANPIRSFFCSPREAFAKALTPRKPRQKPYVN